MLRSVVNKSKFRVKQGPTFISTASFLAIPLIFSYLMIGFFLRLRRTADIPWTERSRAAGSHEFGVDPYSGLAAVGV
jgi:hypothetical protein